METLLYLASLTHKSKNCAAQNEASDFNKICLKKCVIARSDKEAACEGAKSNGRRSKRMMKAFCWPRRSCWVESSPTERSQSWSGVNERQWKKRVDRLANSSIAVSIEASNLSSLRPPRSFGNLCRILCQISPPRSGHFFLLLSIPPTFLLRNP